MLQVRDVGVVDATLEQSDAGHSGRVVVYRQDESNRQCTEHQPSQKCQPMSSPQRTNTSGYHEKLWRSSRKRAKLDGVRFVDHGTHLPVLEEGDACSGHLPNSLTRSKHKTSMTQIIPLHMGLNVLVEVVSDFDEARNDRWFPGLHRDARAARSEAGERQNTRPLKGKWRQRDSSGPVVWMPLFFVPGGLYWALRGSHWSLQFLVFNRTFLISKATS